MFCILRGSHLKTRYIASLFGRKHSFFLAHSSWIPSRVLNKFSDPQIIVKPNIHLACKILDPLYPFARYYVLLTNQSNQSQKISKKLIHRSCQPDNLGLLSNKFVLYYAFFYEFKSKAFSWMFRFNKAKSFVTKICKNVLQIT